MQTKNKIKTPLLFTVFFVLVSFVFTATLYAGQEAECPCFSMENLEEFAPAGELTQHVEQTVESGTFFRVSRQAVLTDAEMMKGCFVDSDACCYYESDSCGIWLWENETCSGRVVVGYESVDPKFKFEVVIGPDGFGLCSGYDTASGMGSKDGQLLTEAEAKACMRLLLDARNNEIAPYIGGNKRKQNQNEQ